MKIENKNRRLAGLLLFCFLTGQFIILTHSHSVYLVNLGGKIFKDLSSNQSITTKCNICDAIHHTQTDIIQKDLFFLPIIISETIYNRVHDYKGIALILSAGRSPPRV